VKAHAARDADANRDDQLLTTKELAEKFKRSESTIRRWHSVGFGPPGFRVAGMLMFRESKANEWIAEQEQQAGAA